MENARGGNFLKWGNVGGGGTWNEHVRMARKATATFTRTQLMPPPKQPPRGWILQWALGTCTIQPIRIWGFCPLQILVILGHKQPIEISICQRRESCQVLHPVILQCNILLLNWTSWGTCLQRWQWVRVQLLGSSWMLYEFLDSNLNWVGNVNPNIFEKLKGSIWVWLLGWVGWSSCKRLNSNLIHLLVGLEMSTGIDQPKYLNRSIQTLNVIDRVWVRLAC